MRIRTIALPASYVLCLGMSKSDIARPRETGADITDDVGSQISLARLCDRPETKEAAGYLVFDVSTARSIDPAIAELFSELSVDRDTPSAADLAARITEARRDGMETVFILEGGSALTSDGILALREAL